MTTAQADLASRTEPRLLDRLASVIRARHMSRSSEKIYRHWVRRFILSSLATAT